MASLYEVLYNKIREEGYSPGYDSGEWGGYTQEQYRPITLEDGRQAFYNPSTGQIQVAGNRRAEGAGEVYDLESYNNNGTTARETVPYQANDWKHSLYGALAVSLPFLAPTIMASAGIIGAAPGAAAATAMDTAGLDALIAQQSAAYPAAGTAAGTAASTVAAEEALMASTQAGTAGTTGYAAPAAGAAAAAGAGEMAGTPGVDVNGTNPPPPNEMTGTPGVDVQPGDPDPITGQPSRPPVAGTPTAGSPTGSGNQQQDLLERLMNGGMTARDLLSLFSGAMGAYNQYNFGKDLLERANQATPNRMFYEGQLRSSYENPGAYLQGPDATAAMDIMHNKIQRSDAGRGQLGNTIGREVTLNNHMMGNLNQYRQGLAGIVGQQANTYSAQNQTAAAGMAANNSWSNGLLYPLLQQGQSRG